MANRCVINPEGSTNRGVSPSKILAEGGPTRAAAVFRLAISD